MNKHEDLIDLAGIVDRVEARRKELGMSSVELQDKAGITSQQMTNWKVRGFPSSHIAPVAIALEMSFDELATGRIRFAKPRHFTLSDAPLCDGAEYVVEVDGSQFAKYPAGALLTVEPWNEYHDDEGGLAIIKPKGSNQAIVCLVIGVDQGLTLFARLVGGEPLNHPGSIYNRNNAEVLGAICDVSDLQYRRKSRDL